LCLSSGLARGIVRPQAFDLTPLGGVEIGAGIEALEKRAEGGVVCQIIEQKGVLQLDGGGRAR
jgi:hypothetical protein